MTNEFWKNVVEAVRYYPSPHNSQPIKLEITGDAACDVYYDLDLGLPAESYGIPFAHVCGGVFLESLRVVVANYGMATQEELYLNELDFSSSERLHRFARVTFVPRGVSAEDKAAYEAFMRRQTNRRPYDNRLVPEDIIEGVKAIARRSGHTFAVTNDKKMVREIVRVNQATLFDDLQNDAVYHEIMQWLRFSRREAAAKNDGLSAETMLLPGRLLRFFMNHRGLWSLPVIGSVVRYVYLRTMKGVRQLGWIEGPFAGPGDFIEAGRTFMKIWIYLTKQGVYLHPFGTVITNPRSHGQFVKKAGIHEEGTAMAWMLFRFGYAKRPPKALRRPAEVMVVRRTKNG